ncbi:hypothetical protein TSUD_78870 [Trifolium subterraneum]|uniref:Reverse transcriptase domain-containing protein n=1 Tax=Trifolium subterraneum TaxID=3900 RepID=A0A2Z6LTC3_TRISU|nr:hypothetical protein TSUD_78870 [Trifolium subterraneum]
MSRLDRFLLSEDWCLTWANCIQTAQLRGLSDHCPLVLSVDEENWGPRPVRMLKCWHDTPGFRKFVIDKWSLLQVDGWGGFVLKEKLKLIKLALKEWHNTHAKNIPGKINDLKIRLSVLDSKGEEGVLTDEERDELRSVSADIHSLSRVNASICWQQSRLLWLREGDANSRYFHSVLASRRRQNALSVIMVDSVRMEGVQPIRQAVFNHFSSHFRVGNMDWPTMEDLQFNTLSFAKGGSLVKPFSVEEVKAAIWNCDSYKSPGPDGINFGFLKEFWPEMRVDTMRFITEFHRNGKLSKGINSTFITLIPKVDSPQKLNDFRPISLVGSLYKILAKVLANRLRTVIGSVISETQTAFVKERQILDGILIANEVVDEARKSQKELTTPWIGDTWICPTYEFPMERGLRQGDPLSPFLFLLAAEGLNVMMRALVQSNLFKGYSIGAENRTVVSHLQFADDTLLLGAKSWANVRALRVVFVLFEKVSGLKVNFHKSMLVGVNIGESWLMEAASALGCKEHGGLGVRLLREFNTALLGKWCWRMLVDRGGMWYRVLAARRGGWFAESVVRRVGNGADTLFWSDPWLGGAPLSVRYKRLFDLALNQSISVADMCLFGWENGGAGWQWRRQLWVWEEELLVECTGLLHDIVLHTNISDSWIWRHDISGGYSVREAYSLLTTMDVVTTLGVSDLIWHKQAPP